MKRILSITLGLMLSLVLPLTAFASTTGSLSANQIYGSSDVLLNAGWELDGNTAKFLPTAGELALIPKIDASKSFTLSFDMTNDFAAMTEVNANVKEADMVFKLRVPTENESYIQIRAKFGYKRDDGSAWNQWLIEPQFYDGHSWSNLTNDKSWVSVSKPGTLKFTLSHTAGTNTIQCVLKQDDVTACDATWKVDSNNAWTTFTSYNALEIDLKGESTDSLAYSISNLALTVDGKDALQQTLYNVTATAENGTVTGTGNYALNQSVTLTATPSTGYSFDGWYKGDQKLGSAAAYTMTVAGDTALTAKFVKNSSSTTAAPANGASTTSAATSTGSTPVKTGETAPVAAAALLVLSGAAVFAFRKTKRS